MASSQTAFCAGFYGLNPSLFGAMLACPNGARERVRKGAITVA
jgi:hypothetical protein